MAMRGNGGTAATRLINRSDRATLLLIALSLAALSVAVPARARAQTQPAAPSGGPISLLPGANTSGGAGSTGAKSGTSAAPPPTTVRGVPAGQGGASPAGTSLGSPGSNGGQTTGGQTLKTVNGIGIGTLAAPNPSEVGTLDTAAGALPPTLWQGSSLALVQTLLPKLPVSRSPAMQNLARRLLLSPGTVPAGAAKGPSLIALRVRTLLALGNVPGALALVKAAVSATNDPAFSRAAIDTYWLSGETHAACGRVFQLAKESTANAALEDSAFCHLMSGEKAAAGIDVGLLHEQKGIGPAFFQLYARLTGFRRKPVDGLSDPTPLLLAMLAATKDPPPAAIVDRAKPAVATFVAGMAHAPIRLRLIAAEQAVAEGGLPAAMLRKLYASVSFSEQELADPPKVAKKLGDARGNALMYQAVRRESEPLAEAEALQVSFRLAKTLSGTALPVLRADEKRLDGLTPARDLAWFAPDAVRALLALGQVKAAAGWYALLAGADADPAPAAPGPAKDEDNDTTGSGRADGVLSLAPVIALAGVDAPADATQRLTGWYAAPAADPAQHQAEAELFFTLSDALGQTVPERLWLPLYLDTGLAMAPTPTPALRHGLAQAASAKRIGETVLFSLVTLGPGGPAVASPGTLANVISALDAVGLGPDAHRIAVEAALGGV